MSYFPWITSLFKYKFSPCFFSCTPFLCHSQISSIHHENSSTPVSSLPFQPLPLTFKSQTLLQSSLQSHFVFLSFLLILNLDCGSLSLHILLPSLICHHLLLPNNVPIFIPLALHPLNWSPMYPQPQLCQSLQLFSVYGSGSSCVKCLPRTGLKMTNYLLS